MASPQMSQLCRVCKQINFAAILTPREWNAEAGRSQTIFRPEWNGNGKSPDLEWTGYGKTKRTGPSEDYLPQIRTAEYDDLSVSTIEAYEVLDTLKRPAEVLTYDPSIEANSNLAAELSDIEDEDGYLSEQREGVALQDTNGADGAKSQGHPLKGEQRQKDFEIVNADEFAIRPVSGFENRPKSPSEVSARSTQDRELERDVNEVENGQDYDSHQSQDKNGDWSDDDDEYDDDRDSHESASTWSNNSHFTEIQRIDLDKQAQGNWNYRHGQLYYLGSIWDLRSRRHECDLCWRLWRQTRLNPDVKNEYLTKSRCILKIMELKGRRNEGTNREVIMLNLVYIYGYKLHDPRYGDWMIRTSFVLHGAHRDVCDLRSETATDQIIPFSDRLFGQARWRNDECNYGLFREWLRVCETNHDHHIPEPTGEMAIRLIDVQRKCLIEWSGPTSEAPRFLALSYVWGTSQQEVMLTTDQLSEFKGPGFLDRPLDQTIRDSIDLVSRMGEKYLWIDALCICQNSREDKVNQIPQMHKIYGKAIVTIVAGYGYGADWGLPGVGVKSRIGNRFKLELNDIQILFRGNTKIFAPGLDIGFTEHYLRSSVYQGRAWTFQESHLSTRVLVFTKDQVYWECEKCTWCEETHWESDSVDFVSWRAVKDPVPEDVWQDRFERRAYDILGADELEKSEPPRNSYAALIKEYSNRDLSHNEDILDACTGVLSSIKEREQSDFLFALRTKHFGNDLLFNILKAVPRRFPDQTSVESGFPSWSWVSWKGGIDMANEPRNNSHDLVENVVPCDGVKCYMLETDQHGKRNLRVINKTGGWRFRQNYARVGEGIYDPAGSHIPARTPHQAEEAADVMEGSPVSGTPQNVQDLTQDQSNPTALPQMSAVSEADTETREASANIVEYSQDLTLADIESHPAFSEIVPNFHIIFPTFSSIVVLRTEYDEMSIALSKVVIAGTKKTRGGGVWENRDHIQRKLYVCRNQNLKRADTSPTATREEQHPNVAGGAGSRHDSAMDDSSTCPCCGIASTPDALPDGLELGPYIGRLPPLSTSWNPAEYIATIPDGVYRLLWMNNNQLPMFGHLLCKPASTSASATRDAGNWDAEILQRVSGVVGPTGILHRQDQEKYAAEWGVFVLG
jgi:Heterokaryon incompatibility protein (HET)